MKGGKGKTIREKRHPGSRTKRKKGERKELKECFFKKQLGPENN